MSPASFLNTPLFTPWLSLPNGEVTLLAWVLVVGIGWCVGVLINALADWLPAKMEYDWQAEARGLLNLTSEDDPFNEAPRLNLFGPSASANPLRHTLIKITTPALSLLTILWFGLTLQGLAACVLTWALLTLATIDLETRFLPDDITLPLLWLGLLVNLVGTFTPLADAVIGAALGYSVLWLLYWGFRLATGQEGMGFGDFKLLAALGAWLGWAVLPILVFVAAVLGIVWALLGRTLQLWRHTPTSAALLNSSVSPENWAKDAFPFGPALAASGLLHLFLGQTLLSVLH